MRARRRVVRTIAPAYTVGAICVIERADGAVLLVRLPTASAGACPAGCSSGARRPADAARREVLEEVGLEIELVGEPAVVVDADAQRVDVVFRARLGRRRRPDAAAADVARDRRGRLVPARRRCPSCSSRPAGRSLALRPSRRRPDRSD